MKKAILSFIFSTSLIGLTISCWCPEVLPYWTIDSYEVHITDRNDNPPVNGKVNTDSIYINVSLDTRFLAQSNVFNPFINSSYATSPCPRDGHEGMKDPISNIIITSNQNINSYPAESPLNDIVLIQGMSIEDWLGNQYYNWYIEQGSLKFILTERPSNSLSHIFRVRIELASGAFRHVDADSISWN